MATRPPTFLAPMEGVTDRTFRKLILETCPGAVGATCTEFLRITDLAPKLEKIEEELGEPTPGVELGMQLMGHNTDALADSARVVGQSKADFLDLNFGCPAPRVFRHGAGSALLANPAQLESLTRAVVDASPIPVSAKIRAGVSDDTQLEEIVQRLEQAGVFRIGVHARLKTDRYTDPSDWTRITRAVKAVGIPIIGNGSVDTPADVNRMLEETGCACVMVGRAVIGNPWFFEQWDRAQNGLSPITRSTADALPWLKTYVERILAGATPQHTLGKAKQCLKAMTDAQFFPQEIRTSALRSPSLEEFFGALEKALT